MGFLVEEVSRVVCRHCRESFRLLTEGEIGTANQGNGGEEQKSTEDAPVNGRSVELGYETENLDDGDEGDAAGDGGDIELGLDETHPTDQDHDDQGGDIGELHCCWFGDEATRSEGAREGVSG